MWEQLFATKRILIHDLTVQVSRFDLEDHDVFAVEELPTCRLYQLPFVRQVNKAFVRIGLRGVSSAVTLA